jgi:UDP-N-acetylglucosamine--N-acetylmuramyl-(pentapeptide) pyrophosphoryl-undecaprenol N-acetylglucosamine transferase
MPVLLVAATGGHLAQMDRLAPRIPGFDDDAIWVTFDTPQSRSLLEGRHHVFVPFTATRDVLTALRNTRGAGKIVRATKPSLVVSTGNAIAVSFLPVARALGVPAAYIESAARAEGPSLTGRIMRLTPGVQLFSQYQGWRDPRWTYAGSVFDEYIQIDRPQAPAVKRVLVTLGTIKFGFRRLVERVMEIVPSGCEVVWQVGSTNVDGLEIDARTNMSSRELSAEMRRTDVVIAHAGIGSALAALDSGKCPVLVPRERIRGEHIDDHQSQIATKLDALSLAVHRPAEHLSIDDLELSTRRIVVQRDRADQLKIAV